MSFLNLKVQVSITHCVTFNVRTNSKQAIMIKYGFIVKTITDN